MSGVVNNSTSSSSVITITSNNSTDNRIIARDASGPNCTGTNTNSE